MTNRKDNSMYSPQIRELLERPKTPLEKLQQEYLQTFVVKNRSVRTIEYWAMNLTRFNVWCQERGIEELSEFTLEILNSYRQYLFHYRSKRQNKPLKFGTQHNYLMVVRRWFRWLAKRDLIDEDIGKHFELPRKEKRLPIDVFTAEEMEAMLNATDVTTEIGIRDRAIMETVYSTGIRNAELIHLELYDLNEDQKSLIVRKGKGDKDRVLPIGERAIKWTRKYIADVRPKWMRSSNVHSYIFVNLQGRKFSRSYIAQIVNKYKKMAGIKKEGSCHLIRHTVATLMLNNGADIRSLQEYLGHSKITTTQIYTHVSISRLQEIHAKTHPASILERQNESN